jgi:hypothetical protein
MDSIACVPLVGWYMVRVLVGRKDFFLLQNDQTSSGALSAPGSFLGLKRLFCEVNHCSASRAYSRAIHLLPLYVFMMWV